MSKQICFFEKNFLDLDNESATITATLGNEFAAFMRNRSLRSAWMTTDSVDADSTVIDFDLSNVYSIDRIILVDHNLKSYTFHLYDPDTALWTLIHTASNDLLETTEIPFTEFFGQRLKITITATKVANSDKRIARIVVTKKLGQFSYWPKISSTVIDQGKSLRKTLSGKAALLRTVGAFRCKISLEHWRNTDDLELIEALYRQVVGFEMWLGGGDETQFFYAAEGYRSKDLYLVGLVNDWSPNLKNGIYLNGIPVELELAEVVS